MSWRGGARFPRDISTIIRIRRHSIRWGTTMESRTSWSSVQIHSRSAHLGNSVFDSAVRPCLKVISNHCDLIVASNWCKLLILPHRRSFSSVSLLVTESNLERKYCNWFELIIRWCQIFCVCSYRKRKERSHKTIHKIVFGTRTRVYSLKCFFCIHPWKLVAWKIRVTLSRLLLHGVFQYFGEKFYVLSTLSLSSALRTWNLWRITIEQKILIN